MNRPETLESWGALIPFEVAAADAMTFGSPSADGADWSRPPEPGKKQQIRRGRPSSRRASWPGVGRRARSHFCLLQATLQPPRALKRSVNRPAVHAGRMGPRPDNGGKRGALTRP